MEGYGQTEDMAGVLLTRVFDPVTQHLGGPGFSFEIKLRDVPELGFHQKLLIKKQIKKDLVVNYVYEDQLYVRDILEI